MNFEEKTKEELIIGLKELQHEYNSLKAAFEKDMVDRKEADEEILRHSRELATLLRISQELATTLDLAKVLQIIADRVTELTELKSSAIYLLEGENLHLWATTPPLPPMFPEELRKAPIIDHPHIHKAITTGLPIFLFDAANADLTAAERAVCELRGLRSILYMPLFVGTQALGALIVTTSEEPKKLTEAEINLFNTFANLAAIGVGNAHLYESQKSDARKLENRVVELKQAQEILHESERKFRDIFEANMDGITILSINQNPKDISFFDMNENSAKMLGYTKIEMLKMHPSSLEPNVTKEEIEKRIDDFRFKGFSDFETTFSHKNGREIIVEIKAQVIRYNHQLAVMNIVRDITQRKKAEEELIKAKEKAEESDKLKTAFLCNMSHEIRTPMNGILGFSNLLNEPGLESAERQAYIKIIQKSGTRMLNILSEIIEISKIESGQMGVRLLRTNIHENNENIYNLLKPDAEKKGIDLSFKNSLPDKAAFTITDNEKLFSILTNLVKNAIKYTDKGSVEFGYEMVKTSHALSLLKFYVKDTGIGIPKKRQEAIFERFIQADIADVEARQGAGLGLAISKAYVEMIGGTIWVESEVGIGSTFFFTLPYNSEPEEEIVDGIIVPGPDVKNKLNPQVSGLKILIAEDDEASGMLLSITVKKISKEVIRTRTGRDAIEICRANPDLDLILMDIQIPELNGYEATRQIRQFNRNVIIIAQTAFGLTGDREKSIEAGCNDYISKPIKKDELLALIFKYFEKETRKKLTIIDLK